MTWWRRTIAAGTVAVAVLLALAAAPATAAPAGATAEVGGTIVTPGTFTVSLYDRNPVGASASKVLTGVTGAFRFTGLAAGTYYLAARDPSGALLETWGPSSSGREDATPLVVAAGGSTALDLTLVPRSSIGGLVYDDEGPVADVVVQAYTGNGTFVRSARTDAEGVYRMTSLPVGNYRMSYRDPSGAHVATIDGGGPAVGGLGPYLPPNGALTLDRYMEPTSSLAGVVTDGGTPLAGVRVALYRDGASVKVLTTDAAGAWTASGLTPGPFVVGYSDPTRTFVPVYHGDGTRMADAEPIAVDPGTTTDLEAVLTRR